MRAFILYARPEWLSSRALTSGNDHEEDVLDELLLDSLDVEHCLVLLATHLVERLLHCPHSAVAQQPQRDDM